MVIILILINYGIEIFQDEINFKFLAFLLKDVLINDADVLFFSILLFKFVIFGRDVTIETHVSPRDSSSHYRQL